MLSKEFMVNSEYGFHLRPAQILMESITPFESKVILKFNGKEANAKSLLNLMTLGLDNGQSVTVVVDGPDENEVMKIIDKLFEDGFDE